MSESTPKVESVESCDLLVLGASFTGIELLYQLNRRRVLGTITTIVVDAREHHGYIPLVHEIVAGDVDSQAYVLPTAAYVRSLPHATYLVDRVVALEAQRREVRLASGRVVRARAVVVALGSKVEAPTPWGNAKCIFAAKFLDQTAALQKRLASCSEGRLVVIGGGITGVEMAGELAAWCQRSANGCSVTLIEGRPQLLTASGKGASRQATKLLQRLGVDIITDVRIVGVDEHHVRYAPNAAPSRAPSSSGARPDDPVYEDAKVLDCALVIWAGGIRASGSELELGVQRDAQGFIQVDTALCCRNSQGEPVEGVFAGGDIVRVYDAGGQWPLMQRAIECIWQAKVLARNVTATLSNATVSSARAVPLARHRLIRDFPYGISIGAHSLVMYGRLVVNLRALGVAFRRWLMRRYFARYKPLPRHGGSPR